MVPSVWPSVFCPVVVPSLEDSLLSSVLGVQAANTISIASTSAISEKSLLFFIFVSSLIIFSLIFLLFSLRISFSKKSALHILFLLRFALSLTRKCKPLFYIPPSLGSMSCQGIFLTDPRVTSWRGRISSCLGRVGSSMCFSSSSTAFSPFRDIC